MTGCAALMRFGGHRRRLVARHERDLCRLVGARPDITLAELQTELRRRLYIVAVLSTIHNTLRRLGCGVRKSLRAASRTAPHVVAKRRRWRVWQRFMDPHASCSWTRPGPHQHGAPLRRCAPRP